MPSPPRPPRLLLVDDDPGAIHVLNRMLAGDHELRYALSGPAALDTLEDWRPDLVLLDAQMPGMTGTEVCRHIKADASLASIPVVFVTSLDEAGAELLSLELGAAGVVTKPLDRARLVRAVRAALKVAQPAANDSDDDSDDDSGSTSATAPLDPDGNSRPRLLIVDDDPSAVRTLHAALHGIDARFHFATGGQEAIDLARRYRPDVVLLDMYMPGLDGLQTLRALKADPDVAEAQVIVVTRFGHPEMETRALDGGAVDFVSKPYTQAVLKARVGNVLRLREHARAQRQADREHWQRIGNARLARVVAAASDAILTADADGQVVLINAAACRLFGVDAALTIGQPLERLLPGVLPDLQPDGGGQLQRKRIAVTRPSGDIVPMELSFSRLSQGAERLTTVVLHDLSEVERREAERMAKLKAEAALQAKSMMLSYVAHEIGNPLSSIIGLTQLLQNESPTKSGLDRQKILELVAASGEHLRALMRDVLDMHRLESGRFDLDIVTLDARAEAERALNAMRSDPGAARLAFELRAPVHALQVQADRTRLHQCLLNLLSNAIKYGADGPVIEIVVRPVGDTVAFDVQDHGAGLSPEQQRHLFEPFNRLGRTAGAGSGIGLALSRMLALAMNGSLTVRSELGRGCCFTLRLPEPAGKPLSTDGR
jgi:PAS domain S-box-containing protein